MNTKPNEELREKLESLVVELSCAVYALGANDKNNTFKQQDKRLTEEENRTLVKLLQLIQTEIAEAERRAVLKELKAIWNETQHDILPVGLEPVEYTASVVLRRIKQLTEMEVSKGEKE